VHLTWQQAVAAAVALAVLAVVTRTLRARHRWLPLMSSASRELALVLGLFALWQVAGALALTRVAGAFDRAHEILALERWLPLPTELWVQGSVLGWPELVKALNVFYLYAHINSIVVFLVWLFWRHRDRYAWARNTLVLLTGSCLLVQLVPVAPPRMLTDDGFVDTALRYGQSIYGPFGSGIADQLSAMPSVHVGWAFLITFVVLTVSTSRWRWVLVAHPVLTVLVVVATANHYWLDGIVACVLLALSLAAATAWDVRRRATPGRPVVGRAEPEPAAFTR
jgi:hypothetical protein